MNAVTPRHSKEEFAQRGDAIYEQELRALLEPTMNGQFVAIDIESGKYEVDADEYRCVRSDVQPNPRGSNLDAPGRLAHHATFRPKAAKRAAMKTGFVTDDFDAIVSLDVGGADQKTHEFDAVVDSGFNGFLTLPRDLVVQLGLPFRRRGRATLADGSESIFDIYEATVMWDGQPRRIPVDEAETAPLVGMRLMNGYEVVLQVWPGGQVRINTASAH